MNARKTIALRIVHGATVSTVARTRTAARRHRRASVANRARAAAAGASGPGPQHPQGHDRHEVEGELAREGREAPEKARGRGRAARAARVGRERPLDRPPQEQQEHRLRPVVGGVPEELRIEGRDGGGEEARPAPEGESAGPAHDGHEEGAEDDLGPEDGPHRAEGAEERADEVRVDRGVEDEVAAQRRERHRRPPDPAADLDPARLVAGQARSRLEQQIGHPEGERHRGQGGESPARRGLRRGRGLGGSGHEDRPILDRPAARRVR